MKSKLIIAGGFLIFILSCKDKSRRNSYDYIQGTYTGNRFHWHRDFDSSHTNVIETSDTTLGITSFLEIDEEKNLINFGGIHYNNHQDLMLIASNDTISARKDFSTKPSSTITIIKSIKKVIVVNAVYAAIGPYADKVTEEYTKD